MFSRKRPKGRTPIVSCRGASRFLECGQLDVTPDFFQGFGMIKTKKALMELKENSKPYIQHWETWIKSKTCFLSEKEIMIIESYAFKNMDRDVSILQSFKAVNQLPIFEKLNEKLKTEYWKYKDWIILTFLFSIIKLAENSGQKKFMETPISELEILSDIKISFRKLNINSFQDFFEKYSEDDLYKPEVFRKISEIKKLLP